MSSPRSRPAASQLRALDDLVSLGYYRGIVRKLDEIVANDAGHAPFANHLRSLAQQFQLDAMTRIIRQAINNSPLAPLAPSPEGSPAGLGRPGARPGDRRAA